MRRVDLVLLAVLVVVLALSGFAGSTWANPVQKHETTHPETHKKVAKKNAAKLRVLAMHVAIHQKRIPKLRTAALGWRRVYQPTAAWASETPCEDSRGLAYLKWCSNLWKKRLQAWRRQAQNPPHKAQWLCIHRYEGSWTDPNSPYYGGLQMDVEFQQTYGAKLLREKGTADHWTPLEQMWVAEHAYRTRGFWPWPNTARYCGLI